jgi:hypothetical protein
LTRKEAQIREMWITGENQRKQLKKIHKITEAVYYLHRKGKNLPEHTCSTSW